VPHLDFNGNSCDGSTDRAEKVQFFLSTSSLFINRVQPYLQRWWRMWVECLLSIFRK